MSLSLYPTTLPCPQTSTVSPVERRLLSDLPGPRQSRPLQRDYAATERATWFLLQPQADAFRQWYGVDLAQGGRWFLAGWPSPQGGRQARRFQGEPQWSYVHGDTARRMWRVSATLELGGRWKGV